MNTMKHIGSLILMIALLLCSCNNNTSDLEIELPINSVFIPASIAINKADLDDEQRNEIMNLVNNNHIVNDISEVPNDPIGQNEAFHHINFDEYTLLIMYFFKSYSIDTYSNRFYKNTEENTFNWVVRIGTFTDSEDYGEDINLTRFAILVKKLPADADVITWRSLTTL